MSVGTWTPNTETEGTGIDPDFLRRCIELSRKGRLDDLAGELSADEQRRYAPLMTLDRRSWESAVADFSNDELVDLIRFFTLAEMQLTGWEAGNESPVIAINRVLRQRGGKLSRKMLLWIKENSDNRFIPNGGL